MRQYDRKPGFGPYFIRALSPTEQLKSKNGRYFFITVSRVDFENAIFKRKFLFSERVLGRFWYPPAQGSPVSQIWAEIFNFQKKNRIPCEKLYSDLGRNFWIRVVRLALRATLGSGGYTKTRPENKNFIFKIYTQNAYKKVSFIFGFELDAWR